jgi:catechol 2,3-dioxygenase-like lactoylglutathione lyase family enzyme
MRKTGRIKRIPHITLGASDMKRTVSFYEQILGLEKISEWPTGVIFDVAGVELGLEPGHKPEICLLVEDVDKAYRDLKDKGVRFATEPKDQPWGARDATFHDPDGNIFVIESFQCKVCSKFCETYRELLEEHLKKHKPEP